MAKKVKTLANKVYQQKHLETRKELRDLTRAHEALQAEHDALKQEHRAHKMRLNLAEGREKKRKEAKKAKAKPKASKKKKK